MDTDQSNSDAKGEGQFIVTERELDKDNDSETMSETSDIVNNNKMQSPRQISPEEQRSIEVCWKQGLEILWYFFRLTIFTASFLIASFVARFVFFGVVFSLRLTGRKKKCPDLEAAILFTVETRH